MGFALFDEKFRCRSSNQALGAMLGGSVKKHIGRPLRWLFSGGALKLEVAFRHVWTSGKSLSNLELTIPLLSEAEPRRWLVNFYPISDRSGAVQLLAVTFSEVTRERRVELQIGRLKNKFHSRARRGPYLLNEEFSETSARTLEVMSRSVALLRSSALLRSYASQRRIEAGLIRHALFLKSDSDQKPVPFMAAPAVEQLTLEALPAEAAPDFSARQESASASDLAGGSPSPREREVLHLLSDGKSSKEIATILDISTRTVESYRARIMLKLDLHSTAALVRYAVRAKIIEA